MKRALFWTATLVIVFSLSTTPVSAQSADYPLICDTGHPTFTVGFDAQLAGVSSNYSTNYTTVSWCDESHFIPIHNTTQIIAHASLPNETNTPFVHLNRHQRDRVDPLTILHEYSHNLGFRHTDPGISDEWYLESGMRIDHPLNDSTETATRAFEDHIIIETRSDVSRFIAAYNLEYYTVTRTAVGQAIARYNTGRWGIWVTTTHNGYGGVCEPINGFWLTSTTERCPAWESRL